MRRLLLVVCWLAAAQTVCARKPAVRFDLPYTLERGKYVVTVETAAGPRRFAFDTGASQTCISERLSRELGLAASGRGTSGDFEGHRHAITYVRVPYLRMGEATYSDRQVIVLPTAPISSAVWASTALRAAICCAASSCGCPMADSTITLGGRSAPARRVPLPGRCADSLCGKRSCNRRPRGQRGKARMKTYMKFDTGSGALFDCRYDECRAMIEKGILQEVRRTEGHSGNLGWTNRSVVR